LKADQEQRTAKPGLAAFREAVCGSILDRRIAGKVISFRAAATSIDGSRRRRRRHGADGRFGPGHFAQTLCNVALTLFSLLLATTNFFIP